MRSCAVDLKIEEHVQQLSKTPKTSGVGLLIGRIGQAKSFLLMLARVPDQDGSEPSSDQRESSSPVVHLDGEWITEYAVQVKRMLPGGLSVIGLYLIASLKDFEKSTQKLCAIAKQARTDQADGSFLLHIEPATGKLSLKDFSGAAKLTFSALSPVDLKFAPVVSSFTLLKCSVNLDLDATVSEGESTLSGCFQRLLRQEMSRIRSSIAIVGGVPLQLGMSLLDALPDSNGAGGPCTLELLLPLSCDADCYGDPGTRRKAVGRIRTAGCMEGFALMPQRETSAAAVAALQEDLASSLAARLEALEEEAHMVQTSEALDRHPLLAPPSRLAVVAPLLPSRVFIPTKVGFPVCEYVMECEEASDAVSRAAELLGDHIAIGACPDGGESGDRVSVPQAPWDPWSDQETRNGASPQQIPILTTMPLWATLLLFMAVGIAASLAALPLSNWILKNPVLAERDEQFNTAIRDQMQRNS